MSFPLQAEPAAEVTRRQHFVILNRCLMTAAAVALCHCFAWTWLRVFTQQANLAMNSWFGVLMQPLTATTIEFQGAIYRYEISCTFADVWCGLVPLIWMRNKPLPWNVAWLGAWAAGLFVFNITRLSLSDVMFAHGLSWALAHSVVGGICYYLVWRFAKPIIFTNATPYSD